MAPILPTLAERARNLFSLAANKRSELATNTLSRLGPLAARSILLPRDDDPQSHRPDPSKGVTRPADLNNTFLFVLFGVIGAAFVLVGIWFFFWAKNGGFYFKENDWDDYKSTVLRRKGPNGTILSGATPSTQLGGGSVYKDVDDGRTEYTGGLTEMTQTTDETATTITGITAGASDIAGRERRQQKREKKEREKEKKKDRKNRSRPNRRVGEDGVLVDEDAEVEAKNHLRAYRHEKAARVGGINKAAEGSEWDGSTNPENSTTAGSEYLLSNRQSTPTSTPTKKHIPSNRDEASTPASSSKKAGGGIRKVYSTADRTEHRENERIRAEARRLAEKGRAAGGSSAVGAGISRRDFSYQRADHSFYSSRGGGAGQASTIDEEDIGSAAGPSGRDNSRYQPPGSWAESDIADGHSELGTKSYHHVIPGLSSASGSGAGSAVSGSSGGGGGGGDYADERRKKRGAGRYRRE